MIRMRQFLATLFLATLVACTATQVHDDVITISVVGTNDVHGQLGAADDRGGIVAVSAYVAALRRARAADGGAVLYIDAGDMWQGTLESNLVEGASVVQAYNAMGVAAAAIGNHEFDFGPAGPKAIPVDASDDPRGALKKRISEARFPVLAANLIDTATGRPVAWDNVQPSVIVDADGIEVGIIGVMTTAALQTTIAANVTGLSVAPLAETITAEAQRLRKAGATLVIVAAHAGGQCTDFADPADTSSCDMSGEIMQVARRLEPGLVDYIIGGHKHHPIAHIVNGIAITSNYAMTESFGRVDFRVDRKHRAVVGRHVFAPQPTNYEPGSSYEGFPLHAVPEVAGIAAAAAAYAEEMKHEKLGVSLTAPFELVPDIEGALANLVTEALLDSVDGDIVIHNVFGGIRKGLPAGELTYGAVYEMFPFDNLVTVLDLSGRQLRAIIARQAPLRRKAGFAGMRVFVTCTDPGMNVVMRLDDGHEIGDEDHVRVIANDFLAFGGDDILTPAIPAGGFELHYDRPRTRDVLVEWFRRRAGVLDPADFRSHDAPKWNLPDIIPASCHL